MAATRFDAHRLPQRDNPLQCERELSLTRVGCGAAGLLALTVRFELVDGAWHLLQLMLR